MVPLVSVRRGPASVRLPPFMTIRLCADAMSVGSSPRRAEVPVLFSLPPWISSRLPLVRTVLFVKWVVVLSALLIPGPLRVASVRLDIHTLLVAGFLALLGYQLVLFAVFTKIFAIRAGFHPPHPVLQRIFRYVTLEVGVAAGALMVLVGLVALILAVASWGAVGFGNLDPSLTMREVIPAVVLLALGTQTVFASFFISILSIDTD